MVNIKKIKFYILLVLMIASLLVVLGAFRHGYDVSHYFDALEGYKIPELLYVGWIVLAVATTLPISAIIFAGILQFTFMWAMIYAFIGIIIGAVATFYLSRWLGEDYVKTEYKSKHRGKMHRLNILLQKNSRAYVILLAFIYIFPTNLAYMLAGVTNMKLREVVLITVLGNVSTALGVGMIFLGVLKLSPSYATGGIIILIIVNIIPILLYYEKLKELIKLVR